MPGAMEVVALVVALLLGALGFLALLVVPTYATWRVHRDARRAASDEQRRQMNWIWVLGGSSALAGASLSAGSNSANALLAIALVALVVLTTFLLLDLARALGEVIARRKNR